MTALESLKKAQSRADLAALLNFKPAALSYILFKMDEETKYRNFEIPKKSGGTRSISAPAAQLKLLQRRLANLLQDCLDEIQKGTNSSRHLSHGFRRDHSIFTNAVRHKSKKFIFNIDIEDFFTRFNFGRVRGFFIKDLNFSLHEDVATSIAQIACHNNSLPQGAPSSPVITNLIFHITDLRLSSLSSKNRCTYTRYADDITFSTNSTYFPEEISIPTQAMFDEWAVGKKLADEIRKAGFSINFRKVRMQYPGSRMDVTGLSVNKIVNTKREYRLSTRAMVHRLIEGERVRIGGIEYDPGEPGELKAIKAKLGGRLAHIHHIDRLRESFQTSQHHNFEKKKETLSSRGKTYQEFLLFSRFATAEKPIVICEGPTDSIYLKCALRSIGKKFPQLINENELKIDFLSYSTTTANILHLSGGESPLNDFIDLYIKFISRENIKGLPNPVIILIDNDKGAKGIFKKTGNLLNRAIDGSDPFYRLKYNLYLVALPKISNKETCIEDFFNSATRAITYNGKTFSASKEFDQSKHFGKKVFSEKVVKQNQDTINFTAFSAPLERLAAAIIDYESI